LKLIEPMLGHVLRGIEPQVLAADQGVVALCSQLLVLGPSDLVESVVHVPHDVEAVEHDLAIRVFDYLADDLEERLPHVHRDGLHVGQVV
jgi:hypothetical protein